MTLAAMANPPRSVDAATAHVNVVRCPGRRAAGGITCALSY
jgi:hypothetical protein